MNRLRNHNGISAEEIAENVWLCRGHGEGGVFGDPYDWVCVAIVNGDEAYVKGLAGKLHNISRLIRGIPELLGVNSIVFERRVNGVTTHHEYRKKV